jgi:hypothetical protein
MLATQGNLRIDQRYKIIDVEYNGKFSEALVGETCQNCGLFITNIAIVEGETDKQAYRIGLDCASTLTTIEPDEISQAKKLLARRTKFLKFLAIECKTIFKGKKDEHTWAFKHNVEKWQATFTYRWFSFEKYRGLIEKYKIKVINDDSY